MSNVGRLLAGGGLFAGVVSLLALFVKAAMSFETLKDFKDAFQLYGKYLRVPVAKGLGIETVPIAAYALDALVLWMAVFLAINAFVQKIDGSFVWGHIKRGYCFREKQNFFPLLCCVLPKFTVAFLAAPAVCLLAIWANMMLGQASITMAYMTIEPKPIARYMLALFAIPSLIILALPLLNWASAS